MRAYEFVADVDSRHHVEIDVPPELTGKTIRVIVLDPDPGVDEVEADWTGLVARQWADELGDSREDIYTLDDGIPADAAR